MVMKDERPGKDWDKGDDHEGSMAVNQLHRLNDISAMLMDMISSGDDLPAWVQSKLTRAYTDLNDVFGYLEPQADEQWGTREAASTLPAVAEAKKKKKGLWANIHAKRKRGEPPTKPGDKNYPKTLDIG